MFSFTRVGVDESDGDSNSFTILGHRELLMTWLTWVGVDEADGDRDSYPAPRHGDSGQGHLHVLQTLEVGDVDPWKSTQVLDVDIGGQSDVGNVDVRYVLLLTTLGAGTTICV